MDTTNKLAEEVKRLANEYAHCYSFVRDDTMPRKKAELEAAIDKLADQATQPADAVAEKLAELKRLADVYGLACVNESDEAGKDIRSRLNSRTDLHAAIDDFGNHATAIAVHAAANEALVAWDDSRHGNTSRRMRESMKALRHAITTHPAPASASEPATKDGE